MNVLAIDTSTMQLGIGIVSESGHVYSHRWDGIGHSAPLFGRITDALEAAELQTHEIELLAVVNGPGSFTGLRIGLAGLLGWAVGQRLPIQPVDSFAAMRTGLPAELYPVLIAIHSRGDEFYMQYLLAVDDCSSEPFIGEMQSALDAVAEDCTVCGSGAERFMNIAGDNTGFRLSSPEHRAADMIAVCREAERRYSARPDGTLEYAVEPYYMTLSQAELKFRQRGRQT